MNQRKRNAVRLTLLLLLAVALPFIAYRGPTQADDNEMWVAVMEDSPDAVLLESDDRFADPVTVLLFNERVSILNKDKADDEDEPSAYYQVRVISSTKNRGKKGYIRKSALSKQTAYQGGADDPKAATAIGAEGANTAAKGLNSGNEATLKANDPKFKKAIAQVDRVEETVNQLMTGDAKNPDPRKTTKEYRDFQKDGGLDTAKEASDE